MSSVVLIFARKHEYNQDLKIERHVWNVLFLDLVVTKNRTLTYPRVLNC